MTDGEPAAGRLDLAAIILAGGRGSRLGQPKAAVRIAGETLLDRALRAAEGVPAVVVGGPELDPALAGRPEVSRVRESPPFSGPAAAIGAGWAELERRGSLEGQGRLERRGPASEWVLLLACDLPFAPDAVPVLLDTVPAVTADEDGVCFSLEGRPQWLCGVYRGSVLSASIRRVADERGLASAPVRSLFDAQRLRMLDDADRLATDIDTPDDLSRVVGRIGGQEV